MKKTIHIQRSIESITNTPRFSELVDAAIITLAHVQETLPAEPSKRICDFDYDEWMRGTAKEIFAEGNDI